MASVETTLIAAVSPLVGGRVFPDFAPYSTPRPFATWQQIGGDVPVFVEGAIGSQRKVRMQVNVWSDTRQEAIRLMRQIETALVDQLAEPEGGAISLVDEDAGMRGATQDFALWGDA